MGPADRILPSPDDEAIVRSVDRALDALGKIQRDARRLLGDGTKSAHGTASLRTRGKRDLACLKPVLRKNAALRTPPSDRRQSNAEWSQGDGLPLLPSDRSPSVVRVAQTSGQPPGRGPIVSSAGVGAPRWPNCDGFGGPLRPRFDGRPGSRRPRTRASGQVRAEEPGRRSCLFREGRRNRKSGTG